MNDRMKELHVAEDESETRPLAATFTLTSDLKLIARSEGEQRVYDMSTYQAQELGRQLIAAARRAPVKVLQPLSCCPHITTLDVRPYRVVLATGNPVPFSEGVVVSVEGGPDRVVPVERRLSEPAEVHVLDLSVDAINLEGPELELRMWPHDPLRVIGRIRGMFLEPGRLTGIAFFDSRPAAQLIREQVDSGAIVGLSLGYRIEESTKLPDGRLRVTRWTPIEVTICPPGGRGDHECVITPLS